MKLVSGAVSRAKSMWAVALFIASMPGAVADNIHPPQSTAKRPVAANQLLANDEVQSYSTSTTYSGATGARASRAKIIDNPDTADDEKPPAHEDSAQTKSACELAQVRLQNPDAKIRATALPVLAAAVKNDPDSLLARRLYAFALVRENKPHDALTQLAAVAKVEALNPSDKTTMGDAYMLLTDFTKATIAFTEAQAADPNLFFAESGLVRVLAINHRRIDALKECQKAMQRFRQPKQAKYFRDLYAAIYKEESEDASKFAAPPPQVGPGDMPFNGHSLSG